MHNTSGTSISRGQDRIGPNAVSSSDDASRAALRGATRAFSAQLGTPAPTSLHKPEPYAQTAAALTAFTSQHKATTSFELSGPKQSSSGFQVKSLVRGSEESQSFAALPGDSDQEQEDEAASITHLPARSKGKSKGKSDELASRFQSRITSPSPHRIRSHADETSPKDNGWDGYVIRGRKSNRENPSSAISSSFHRSTKNEERAASGVAEEENARPPVSIHASTGQRTNHSRQRSDESESRSSSVSRSHYLSAKAGLNEGALADALVASSLASSLASSRAPSPAAKPELPPRRKTSRTRALFHRAHSSEVDPSRPTVPHVGMKQTLRKDPLAIPTTENDQRGHKHFMNRPNKHREGSRKRWRDEVTEGERKRYEGVWAANKGVLLVQASKPSNKDAALDTATSELVLDLVVRDIWNRSRLPTDFLAEIWDLVNLTSVWALTRDEFVVGLWLIDQKLKGRKLPVRVSEFVWASVHRRAGIKIPRNL